MRYFKDEHMSIGLIVGSTILGTIILLLYIANQAADELLEEKKKKNRTKDIFKA